MTTKTPGQGRPNTSAARTPRAATRLLLSILLAAAPALPAFAQQATPATAANAPALMPDAMTLPDRALMLASDINTLLVSGKTAAVAADYQPTDGKVKNVLQRALALLGTPYRWGGTTTDGFDCSGLVGYVFRTTIGIDLPRVSRDMAHTGKIIERSELSPGDLVFFGRRKGRVDHVGIYVGEGNFVHAPRTGREVTVSTLEGGYWGSKFIQARRVAGS